MSTRNFEEYRAEVLEQLGATAEDLRNEPSWRAKVLEALGAEYTDEDTRNFERYRLKVLENLSGGGSGGGGSSVFSTAEVTVVNEIDDEVLLTYLPILQGDTIRTDYSIDTVGTTTYTIALYKGSAIINYGHAGDSLPIIDVSGNATDDMEGHITITGNCTLTYSAGL